MPMDGWLSDFSYKVSNKKIKLSGYAVSASKLIPILEESKLLENVKFTSPITTDRKSEKEKFRIEMTVSSEKK
jgi:general secretion pathway protein L